MSIVPKIVQVDNGFEFDNSEFICFVKSLAELPPTFIKPRHPQTNGMVKQTHLSLCQRLQIYYIEETQKIETFVEAQDQINTILRSARENSVISREIMIRNESSPLPKLSVESSIKIQISRTDRLDLKTVVDGIQKFESSEEEITSFLENNNEIQENIDLINSYLNERGLNGFFESQESNIILELQSQSNFENTEIPQESSESGDANDDSNYCYYMSGKDPVYESDKDRMYSADDVE
ncbi:hypothetical protein BB559_002691 [Furculomyces boomerangus]|uniref:Integrase catalytic domain-containing protein n=1 Tax=Furculomyces boomerangus TaxID=61424 RepID=A0A2T9YT88_9FUNG|nr:hypothetical protein BB559_002691 [Furculomyces boomerangus]